MTHQFLRSTALLLSLGFFSSAHAVKIAVTDLTYAETVNQYFRDINYHETPNASDPSLGVYHYIEYGELHKFVGDIGDELIHSGLELTHAKPYSTIKNEKVSDVIAHIKKGDYPNTDYVLFGTVSDLEFRDEITPLIGTNNVANTFSLMLTVEFSLINTKTHEVKITFSASTEGQDVRLGGDRHIMPNRGKIIADVSHNLGVEVAQQINFQLGHGVNPSGDSEYSRAFPTQQLESDIMQFSQ